MRNKSVSLSTAIFLATLALSGTLAVSAELQATPAVQAVSEDQRLIEFLDHAYDEAAALSPELLTRLGSKTSYDRLDDYSDDGVTRKLTLAESQLARLQTTFDPATLTAEGRLSYQLFMDQVEQQRLSWKWRYYDYPVNNSASPTSAIPVFMINLHGISSVKDAESYIARLRDVKRVMAEISDGLLVRAKKGVVAPAFTFDPVMLDARKVISGAPFDGGADSVLLADFKAKLAKLDVPAEVKAKLVADAAQALKGPFAQGYNSLLATLEKLKKTAKTNDGVWALPDGDAYYRDQVKLSTTTALTPEDIHQIGLSEVARIQREMEVIKTKVGFAGSLQDFFAYVKTDPAFQYPNTDAGREAYLKDARAFVAQVMDKAPTLFHRLPKAKLDVRAVEAWRQQSAPIAFYNRPAADGTRPGIYYVNLSDMTQVLKPQIEGISYHEGAPGHHFQIAFAQELEGLPKFRRFGFYGAYIEGWGLYAEKLGSELGFYQDPYSDFGRLSTELWRASRLVADTGLHAKRWTREQAIAFFKANTLLSDRDVVKEIERYMVWPGQAVSYKIGQIEISRLRQQAETRLGKAFDPRDFHEVVLGHGALPMTVLASEVDAYIARKAAGAK